MIGRGHNEREATGDPTAHAEVLAIRAAARHVGEWRLTGCTLVVTLEPCTMCAGAIVLSRLDRLVFAAYDEKAGAVGSLWDVVRDRRLNHRPEVIGGVMADEAGARLRDFFTGTGLDSLCGGGVSERPKERASKAREGYPPSEGSNPSATAMWSVGFRT